MKRRFNEEIQKIDVIEKANYQELVDSVYAAARSGITNIRVRVRDDEYLDLLGDVPTREFKENKLREGKEKLLDEFDWSGLRIELVERGNFICLYAYLENGDCCHNTIWGKEDKKSADYAWNDLKKYLEEFGESSDPVGVLTDWEENLHIPNLNAAPGEKLYGPYEYTLDQCVKVVKNSMYGVTQSAKGLKSTFKALRRHVANRSKFTDDFDGLTDEDLMEIAQAVYDECKETVRLTRFKEWRMINRNTSKFLNESKKKLKENRFDTLEYLYIDGSYALIRKYEQGPFLKKILNGNVFDRLYRYVSAGKLKTKDNPFNVKNWKVGDDILLGLTSTLPFEDPKNLKKDLQVNFSYCIVFKDAKGYSVKYDAKDFAGNVRGIERYKWQKEVLTAGLFHVDNIEQKGKITYVELSTVKQDKETFIEILRKTRKDLESGEFNKQYPDSLGVKYATYDRLKDLLKGSDLEIFNTNNLSQKEIEAIKKLPKINTYEDLYFFIKEYGLYEDLKPMCTEEPPKEFTKEVWNNTLIENHIGLPEDALPQSRKETFNEWNCRSPYETKNWPNVTGEYISFRNWLEGMWFIVDKYFALKSIKEKLEKDSLKESTRSMRKTLKEFDTSWMDDDANLKNIKVEDLIEDKYLDKALEYYELFEELTLRGDYKKAEDRSEEDIRKDQRAIQLLKKLQTNTDPALAYGFMLYDESSITKAYWTKRVGDRKDPHTKKPWFKKDKKAEWLYEVYLVLMDQNSKFPDPLYYYKFTDTTGRFNIMNNFKMHWNMYLLPVLSRSIFKRNVNDYKPLGDSKNDFEIKADYSEDDIAEFLNVEDFIRYFAKKGPVKTKSGSSLEGLTWKKILEEIIKNKDERAVKLSKVLGLSAHSVLYKVTDELKKDMKKFDVDQGSFAKYISKYEDVALNILNGKDVTFSEVGA